MVSSMRRLRGLVIAIGALGLTGFGWPGAERSLAEEFTRASVARRVELVAAVTGSPSPARDALLRGALTDRDPGVRSAALRSVARVRSAPSVESVTALLEDASPRIRALAAIALGALGERGAVPALNRALADSDPSVRLAAIEALSGLGVDGVILAIMGRIDDGEPEVRRAAVRALGVVGDPRATLAVLGALQDQIPEVRVEAARALGSLQDPRGVRALRDLLGDGNLEVATTAARALGALGPAAAEAVDALASVRSRNFNAGADARLLVRTSIAALGRIGGDAAVGALEAIYLEGTDVDARAAATALSSVREGRRPRVAAVAAGTRESMTDALVALLGALGGDDAATALVALLARPGLAPGLRNDALRALGATRSPSALRSLLAEASQARTTAGDRCGTRGSLVSALDGLWTLASSPRGVDPLALDPLVEALSRVDPTCVAVRVRLLECVGATRSPRASDVLLREARSPHATVRGACVRGLSRLSTEGARAGLVEALGDPLPEIRSLAGDALIARPDVEVLRSLLVRWRSAAPSDRSTTARVLGRVSSRLRSTAPEALTSTVIDALAECVERSGDAPPCLDAIAEHAPWSPRARAALDFAMASPGLGAPGLEALSNALASAREGPLRVPLLASARSVAETPSASRSDRLPMALWALGGGDASDLVLLRRSLGDPRPEVSANAAGAIGRIARRVDLTDADRDATRDSLCAVGLAGAPLAVRINALHAVRALERSCDPAALTRVLRGAHDERWRAAAAGLLRARSDGPNNVLDRCANSDPSPLVARACAAARTRSPLDGLGVDAVLLDGEGLPARGVPVVLELPDGTLRYSVTGPEGWVHNRPVGSGAFALIDPSTLRAR